jgi:hypothetical protein
MWGNGRRCVHAHLGSAAFREELTGMPSIFVRAGLVGVLAAMTIALAGIALAAEIPKPVLRPAHDLGPATQLQKSSLPPPPSGPVQSYSYGRIILFHGLMNVFSRGLDALEVEMKQRGLPVELYNHTSWNEVADKLIEDYKSNKNVAPIIIVGHSLGADAALVLANWLIDHGVPVRLVITLDGVGQVATMVGGSAEVINYYKPNGFGQEVLSTHAFKGTISNIDLTDHPEIGHLNIDKNQMIHDSIIAKVLEIMKKKPAVTAAKG